MTELIPNFRQKLKTAYDNALSSGEVVFIPSQVTHKEEDGVDFQVRHAASLTAKPVPKEGQQGEPKKKKDPFAPPIHDHSLICEYEDAEDKEGFRLLLNKFAVVPGHFLLCTREFIPQESPLTPVELYTSHRLLQQFEVSSGDLGPAPHAMFFNCGNASGASQPHKHLQFINSGRVPFERCIKQARPEGLKPGETFCLPAHLLPPAHCIVDVRRASSLDPENAKEFLTLSYLGLLDDTIQNLRLLSRSDDANTSIPTRVSHLSYNLVMTVDWIMLVPRSKAEYYFKPDSSTDEEKLSLNSLGFAGMIMVKYEEQLELMKEHGLRRVLSDVGYPRAVVPVEGQQEQ